jgi:hypothetical protein
MFLKFNTLLATLSSIFERVVPLFVAVLVLSYCPIWTKGSQWGLSPEIVKAIVMLLFHYLLFMILQQLQCVWDRYHVEK